MEIITTHVLRKEMYQFLQGQMKYVFSLLKNSENSKNIKVSLEKVLLPGNTRIGGNLGLVRELTLAIYVLLNASRDEVVGGQCFEEEGKKFCYEIKLITI